MRCHRKMDANSTGEKIKKKRLNVQLKGKATYSNLYRIEKSKCSYVCGSDNLPVSADERCS